MIDHYKNVITTDTIWHKEHNMSFASGSLIFGLQARCVTTTGVIINGFYRLPTYIIYHTR